MGFYRSQNRNGKYSWILVNSELVDWSSRIDLRDQGAFIVDHLQEAIERIAEGGVIWCGGGTYKPTKIVGYNGVTDRCKSFDITGMRYDIYGSFYGNETTTDIGVPGGRQATYDFFTKYTFITPTILSGDLTGVFEDRAYHVLFDNSPERKGGLIYRIDGVYIQDGNASNVDPLDNSRNNEGGGALLYNRVSGSNVFFYNTTFRNNNAELGGAIYSLYQYYTSRYTSYNCCIMDNTANSYGGVYCANISICGWSFINNTASQSEHLNTRVSGGGYYISRCVFLSAVTSNAFSVDTNRSLFCDCLFINQSISTGAYSTQHFKTNTLISSKLYYYQRYRDYSGLIYNSIFYDTDIVISTIYPEFTVNFANCSLDKTRVTYIGNSNATYVEDIDEVSATDFVDILTNDYSLKPWSECVNNGNNLYYLTALDLVGNIRRCQDTVDIGAYELQQDVYIAQFTVTDADGAVEDAVVSLVGVDKLISTDETGEAVIGLLDGESYDYTVSLSGYGDVTGTITINGADVMEAVTIGVLPYWLASFTVKDENNSPISGITITINGQTLTTNSSGQASIQLQDGLHSYSVSGSNINGSTRYITIDGADKQVDINETILIEYLTIHFAIDYPDGTDASDETIEIDGTSYALNSVGMKDVQLTIGDHNLSINIDGYATVSQNIPVSDQTTNYYFITLTAN